jgi:hypothetical protein
MFASHLISAIDRCGPTSAGGIAGSGWFAANDERESRTRIRTLVRLDDAVAAERPPAKGRPYVELADQGRID